MLKNKLRQVIYLLVVVGLAYIFTNEILELFSPITYGFYFWASYLFFGFILIVFLSYFLNLGKHLGKQLIHKQPSWVWYLKSGLPATLFLVYLHHSPILHYKYFLEGFILSVIFYLIIKLLEIIYFDKKNSLRFKNFASDSIGLNQDNLDYSFTAKNVSSEILDLSKYINVVGLYGNYGEGKSSFCRMIIESIENKKNNKEILYTYIPLTKANESKDFSKLFAEAWSESLSKRYPQISPSPYIPIIKTIFRVFDKKIINILDILSSINVGLFETNHKVGDNKSGLTKFEKNKEINRIFGNIPKLKEDRWIIVVDEIERGHIDEINRLVETIERFKSIGRNGFPIKLTFILCISDEELKKYIECYENQDPKAKLIKGFFYDDVKSIDYRISVPPINVSKKSKHVFNKLKKVSENINNYYENEIIRIPDKLNLNISYDHLLADSIISLTNMHPRSDDKIKIIIGILAEESPRKIEKVCNAVEFFYRSFKNSNGTFQTPEIQFEDIIILELIRIRYSFLIDFLKKIIPIIRDKSTRNIYKYLDSKDLSIDDRVGKNKDAVMKEKLLKWIKMECNLTENDIKNKAKIISLFIMSMKYCYDLLDKNGIRKTKKDEYFGTSSHPDIMWDYLTFIQGSGISLERNLSRMYREHKDNLENYYLTNKSNEILIEYTDFFKRIDDFNWGDKLIYYKEIFDEILKRLKQNKFQDDFLDVKTERIKAVKNLADLLIFIYFREIGSDEKDTKKEMVSKIERFLNFQKIKITDKFLFIDQFLKSNSGREVLRDMLNFKVLDFNVLEKIFEDADKRYFSGEKSIYEGKEAFAYLFYNYWSGNIERKKEINTIKKVAERGLEKNVEAIRSYWKIKMEEGHLKLGFDKIYMPVENLTKITKKANLEKLIPKKEIIEDVKEREAAGFKDKEDTLRYKLKEFKKRKVDKDKK